jgi:putative (di)nucleoside polyphosphate hydrolase
MPKASKPVLSDADLAALPYRPCVGVMLVNTANLVWVGRRIDTPDGWQMPQGGIDPGEDIRSAGLRELREEIGTDRADVLAETAGWHRYDLPPELLGRVWKGRFRGQDQKWLLCRFTGQDSDIRIDGKHPEFNAWQWLEPESVVQAIVPFKRAIYRAVIDEFIPLLTGPG